VLIELVHFSSCVFLVSYSECAQRVLLLLFVVWFRKGSSEV